MLLSAQSGIALSTPENIHLSADGQVNSVAKDSINLSTQNNLIAHAKNKLSLFAIQDELNLVAGRQRESFSSSPK